MGEPRRFGQPIGPLQQIQPHPYGVVTETGAPTQNANIDLTFGKKFSETETHVGPADDVRAFPVTEQTPGVRKGR